MRRATIAKHHSESANDRHMLPKRGRCAQTKKPMRTSPYLFKPPQPAFCSKSPTSTPKGKVSLFSNVGRWRRNLATRNLHILYENHTSAYIPPNRGCLCHIAHLNHRPTS